MVNNECNCDNNICNCACIDKRSFFNIYMIITSLIISILILVLKLFYNKIIINKVLNLYDLNNLVKPDQFSSDIDYYKSIPKNSLKIFSESFDTGVLPTELANELKDSGKKFNIDNYLNKLKKKCYFKKDLKNIENFNLCSCIPINNQYISSFYIYMSIGLIQFLDTSNAKLDDKAKILKYNINNFFCGNEAVEISDKIVKSIFNIIIGLFVYVNINNWIILLTLLRVYLSVKGKKNVLNTDNNIFFNNSLYHNDLIIYTKFLLAGLINTFELLLYITIPILIIKFTSKKLKTLKSVLLLERSWIPYNKLNFIIIIFMIFFIFYLLIYLVKKPTPNLITNMLFTGYSDDDDKLSNWRILGYHYFNKIDRPFINLIFRNISINSENNYIKLFFIILLIFCIIIGFNNKTKYIFFSIIIIFLIIYIMSIYFNYQFDEPYVKGVYENEYPNNPYINNKNELPLLNKEFMSNSTFNLTSNYLRLNYCCLPNIQNISNKNFPNVDKRSPFERLNKKLSELNETC